MLEDIGMNFLTFFFAMMLMLVGTLLFFAVKVLLLAIKGAPHVRKEYIEDIYDIVGTATYYIHWAFLPPMMFIFCVLAGKGQKMLEDEEKAKEKDAAHLR